MANRFSDPNITFVDETGAPYIGAQLFFFQSGTDTKLNVYSNEALTIARTNPVILDSAGRAGAIFLQDAPYKVVLAPSDDADPPTSPYWTEDPVYSSDYSTVAQVEGVNGSPNGQLAGTAASATIPASMAWDYVNNILYICTTTGTALTAVWEAVNASTAAAVIPPPQGYLTPTSGTAPITADAVSQTTIYYTPLNGLLVPIYNGASFVPSSIVSELQLTLVASHAANEIYDCYIFSLNGVATLGTGPSWSAGSGGSVTAGSCARGTGAGGAALSQVQGIWTNTASMTMRYGDGTTTTTVNANQGTYVGSIWIDATNGQVSCYLTYGQSRKWGVWNAYNRFPIEMIAGDGTATWSYGAATWRASNNNSANKITAFCGLPQEPVEVTFDQQNALTIVTGAPSSSYVGIGINVTNSPYQKTGGIKGGDGTNSVGIVGSLSSRAVSAPLLGINNYQCLEWGQLSGSSSITRYGTNENMVMIARYRG